MKKQNLETNNEYLKHKIRYFIKEYSEREREVIQQGHDIVNMAYLKGFLTAMNLVLEDLEQ